MFRDLSLGSYLFAAALVCAPLSRALAQDALNPEEGDVSAGASTSASSSAGVSTSASTSSSSSAPPPMMRSSSSSSSVRLAMQGRIDALNIVQLASPLSNGNNAGSQSTMLGRSLMTPAITPGVRLIAAPLLDFLDAHEGVRLIDTRLFLGLGLGFGHADWDAGNQSASQSGFSMVPTATFDVLSGADAALSLGAMFTFASIGETEICGANTCTNANDNASGMGLTGLVGLRGKITESVALGTDFGWGFLKVNRSGNLPDEFIHGLVGMFMLEASLGL